MPQVVSQSTRQSSADFVALHRFNGLLGPPVRPRAARLSALALVALIAATAPARGDGPADFIVNELEIDRFKETIRELAALETRHWAQPENFIAVKFIADKLRSFGYDNVVLDAYMYQSIIQFNVYATKVGTVRPTEMYILGAHLDSINFSNFRDAPGADDDAAGVASVLETARVLARTTTEVSVRFALWNNEETGLNGSAAYVANHRDLQGTLEEPLWIGMIQQDMILYDHGPGPIPDADVEYNRDHVFHGEAMHLAQFVADAMQRYGDMPAEVGDRMDNTDSRSFWNDTPAVSARENQRIAEIGQGSNPHWHQSTDRFDTYSEADYEFGFNIVKMVTGAVAELSGAGCRPCGDMNCDGRIDAGDIDPFFLALADPPAYSAAFANCRAANGDLDHDGRLAGGDIEPFFRCIVLSGPDCNANGASDFCDGIGPLEIVGQPAGATACEDRTVRLAVRTTRPALRYQWRKDGVEISGAVHSVLIVGPLTPADAGDYDVLVGDACVDLTSESATLTVRPAPAINTHPRSQTVCLGAPLVLSVDASGLALTYQWRKDRRDIPGATNPTYTVPAVSQSDGGVYDVVVANSCGTERSDPASVTIRTTILTHPAGQTVCENDPVFFTVGASGASLTYQWRKDAVNISGATQNFFVIAAAALSHAGIYDVVVTSAKCTQTSDPAPLVVQQCP